MSFSPHDAVLVVHAGGKQCALDLRQVAEIRGTDAVRQVTEILSEIGSSTAPAANAVLHADAGAD